MIRVLREVNLYAFELLLFGSMDKQQFFSELKLELSTPLWMSLLKMMTVSI